MTHAADEHALNAGDRSPTLAACKPIVPVAKAQYAWASGLESAPEKPSAWSSGYISRCSRSSSWVTSTSLCKHSSPHSGDIPDGVRNMYYVPVGLATSA